MATPSTRELLTARVRPPQHVVYRSFVTETVVLNLQTGKYHGLNSTAGQMLQALSMAPTVADAAQQVAAEYDIDRSKVEQDLLTLCEGLLQRGLVELVDADTP